MNTGTLLLTLLAGKRHFGKKRYRSTWITLHPDTNVITARHDNYIKANDLDHAKTIFWQYIRQLQTENDLTDNVQLVLLKLAD